MIMMNKSMWIQDSVNGSLPSGNEPLPEPMVTKIYNVHNDLKSVSNYIM